MNKMGFLYRKFFNTERKVKEDSSTALMNSSAYIAIIAVLF